MQKLYNQGNAGKAGTPRNSAGNSSGSFNRYRLFPVLLIAILLMNLSAWAVDCTQAAAGTNQTVCATSSTFAGNAAGVGETGTWTLIGGSGTITTPLSPTSTVTGLGGGANTFVWTISGVGCTATKDTVVITNATPTIAAAGPDQLVFASTATLQGNAPVVGTGAWTVVAGPGAVTTTSSPTSGVTGLVVGTPTTFRWTISSASCTPSTDDVVITRKAPTTTLEDCYNNTAGASCTAAGQLYVGAPCTIGSNENGAASVQANSNCTAPLNPTPSETGTGDNWTSDKTVWYQFTTGTAGIYTVSTDNGTQAFGDDTQLKLFAACGAVFPIGCNEDVDKVDNTNNGFASMITTTLAANTTYYIAVDIFGTGSIGKFCINVFKNEVPSNDCVTGAISINNLLATVSADEPVVGQAYFYNTPDDKIAGIGDEPTRDDMEVLTLGMGGSRPANTDVTPGTNCSGALGDTTFGVWFSFTYDTDNTPAYISVYPNNGANFYVMELFKYDGSGAISTTCTTPENLTFIDCSAGDLQPLPNTTGDTRDKAKGSMQTHPRLDLRELSAVGNLGDGDSLFLFVHQYTRVLVSLQGDTAAAPPSDGIFNLVAEAAPVSVAGVQYSVDGVTTDSCETATNIGCESGLANNNVETNWELSNAGMEGNIFSGNQGNAFIAPNTAKPQQMTATVNSGTFQRNCTGTNFIPVATLKYPNNLATYVFDVNDSLCNRGVISGLCETLDSLLEDTRGNLVPSGFGPVVDSTINTAIDSVQAVRASACNNLVPSSIALLCSLHNNVITMLDSIICANGTSPVAAVGCPAVGVMMQIQALLCTELSAPCYCKSRVNIRIHEIEHTGVNGNRMFAFVFPYNEATGVHAVEEAQMYSLSNTCDTCESMDHVLWLPSGRYCMVIDGEEGQLLEYDLKFSINHTDTITGLDCGVSCGEVYVGPSSVVSKVNTVKAELGISSIRPVPATDYVDVTFAAPKAGQVKLELFDMNGRKVYAERVKVDAAGNITKRLDIASLPVGIYILNVTQNGQSGQRKFVKVSN